MIPPDLFLAREFFDDKTATVEDCRRLADALLKHLDDNGYQITRKGPCQ